MLKSRLIQVLRTFTKKEFREFNKWINSPFHNQREDVITLYNYLLTANNLFDDNLLDKVLVFNKIYPKEKFDDSKMRQVMHFMFRSIEDFLAYIQLHENKTTISIALAKSYRKKRLLKHAEKTIQILGKKIEKSILKNNIHFRDKFYFEEEKYNFLIELKQLRTGLNLQQASDSLETSFIIDKLKQASLIVSHKTVYNTEYDNGLLNKVIEYIEAKGLINKPFIGTYYYIYKTLIETEEDSHFQKLKYHINNFGNIFPPSELGEIYLMAINYCIRRMNAGAKQYIKEAFLLYKQGIEDKVLIEKTGHISRFAFQNVIAIALILKEFNWVENFIHNYKDLLREKYKQSAVHYNLARLYYERGEYDKTTQLFMQFEFKDVLLNLASKTMLLKIYYEQSEFRALESLLESLRAYIQRKKIIGYHKAVYKNIIRYTKKLIKINPYNKAQIIKFKEEVKLISPITSSERAWLLKQIENL